MVLNPTPTLLLCMTQEIAFGMTETGEFFVDKILTNREIRMPWWGSSMRIERAQQKNKCVQLVVCK
jgi:hypothetical protein